MNTDTPIAEQCATAAVVLGLMSVVVCWWFPFGALVGATGGALGLFAWIAGPNTERALVGAGLAACGMGTGALLAWENWQRVFGL